MCTDHKHEVDGGGSFILLCVTSECLQAGVTCKVTDFKA